MAERVDPRIDLLVDHARLERHEHLIAFYKDVPAEEMVNDISIIAQMAMFKARQEKVTLAARISVAEGGTHDCGEWKTSQGACALCGRALL